MNDKTVNNKATDKKKSKEIMEWAVRKQRAHDQAIIANMWFGMNGGKPK